MLVAREEPPPESRIRLGVNLTEPNFLGNEPRESSLLLSFWEGLKQLGVCVSLAIYMLKLLGQW